MGYNSDWLSSMNSFRRGRRLKAVLAMIYKVTTNYRFKPLIYLAIGPI